MAAVKVLSLSALAILISGCQSWQFEDIEELPPTAAIPETSESGKVDAWYFDGISGNYVQNLLDADKYPDSPDEITELTELRQANSRANNYGTLIRGFIEPPQTGEYTFQISGDDQTLFLLSDSESPEGAIQIAATMSTPLDNFTRYASQTSGVQYLEAGKRYYFELRHKEGGWDDHFTVAWSGPGFSRRVIGGNALHSWATQATGTTPELTSEEAYHLGYRIGFFDAEQGLSFSSTYPPLDVDGDKLYDNWEIVYGLDPSNPGDAASDSDNDLLTALDEFWARTNPETDDTDNDGLPDGYEFAYGLDPTNPGDANADPDDDGYTMLQEYEAGTDPTDRNDFPEPQEIYASGFVGQYFTGTEFDNFIYSQRDAQIDFNWGNGSPSSEIPKDRFSVRWQGWFTPPHASGSREYTFSTTTDDGVRLLVDNTVLINQWKNQSPSSYSASADLEAGTPVAITMEYFEFGWGATAKLDILDSITGETLVTSEAIQHLSLDSDYANSSLSDGIDDLYKLRYGLPLMQPTANLVLNSSGVTVLEAYQSGLHPYTLETVAEPDSPITSLPDGSGGDRGSVSLSWTPPGTRVDGSSISLSEIDRYRINYGQDANDLTEVLEVPAGTTSTTVTGLMTGSWYFTIQVIDINGLSSEPSDPVEHRIE
ncbi:PA14 domain-containing protein [Marinobacter daepoensis]|uniref:PA14 domain-containing protein n=1 Tax=Marinobacter daepoensis TaxID=262077 RepID=UPI0003FA7CC9|nr:PA14 domain-containing protein [Marinobacter daepoensis]